jgi:hypothetical protein
MLNPKSLNNFEKDIFEPFMKFLIKKVYFLYRNGKYHNLMSIICDVRVLKVSYLKVCQREHSRFFINLSVS